MVYTQFIQSWDVFCLVSESMRSGARVCGSKGARRGASDVRVSEVLVQVSGTLLCNPHMVQRHNRNGLCNRVLVRLL